MPAAMLAVASCLEAYTTRTLVIGRASRAAACLPTAETTLFGAANYGSRTRRPPVGLARERTEAGLTSYEGGAVSTILIGVDSTARSEDAIALGRDLARAGTAKLVVAAVTSSARLNLDEAHLAVRRMSGLLAGIAPERIRTAVVAAPSPAHGLHELAERESATLVVVGS